MMGWGGESGRATDGGPGVDSRFRGNDGRGVAMADDEVGITGWNGGNGWAATALDDGRGVDSRFRGNDGGGGIDGGGRD